MPMTHQLATQLGAKLTEIRKSGNCDWVRPDGKTQVTCEYKYDDNDDFLFATGNTMNEAALMAWRERERRQ